MRHYILTPAYALRGWKLLPCAIQYLYAPKTEFFREDDWALISACDGQTDIDWNALTDAQRERYAHWEKGGFFAELVERQRLDTAG